jgi:hypothetical protein
VHQVQGSSAMGEEYIGNMEQIEASEEESGLEDATLTLGELPRAQRDESSPSDAADLSVSSELERQGGDRQPVSVRAQNDNPSPSEAADLEGSSEGPGGDDQRETGSETAHADTSLALSDFYADKMKEKNLTLSSKHQEKFVTNKALLSNRFPVSQIHVDAGEHATINVSAP